MEYMIYATALFASILFQIFWAWCNRPSKSKKKETEEKIKIILELKHEMSNIQISHEKEMRELRNQHRRALATKDKERHASCATRNETIKRLKKKNDFLHEQIMSAEERLKTLNSNNRKVVLEVLKAMEKLEDPDLEIFCRKDNQ